MASFIFAPCLKQVLVSDVLRCVLRGEILFIVRNVSSQTLTPRQDFVKCHRILGVEIGSSPEKVREAFLSLAKRFHPDGASPEADRFQEVEAAYRKLQLHFAEQRPSENQQDVASVDNVVEHDIQHTAPQHRQYLSFDGYGAGSPTQREKQHRKMRAIRATENVFEHRIKKLSQNEEGLMTKEKKESRKIKTRYGMDRLVEDLIQESMSKGHFDNLSGSGKPLPLRSPNPYVDFVTQKINEVLIDNGFTPEWITLQKEIRIDTQTIKEKLEANRAKLGPVPLNEDDEQSWQSALAEAERETKALNSKINKYNLLVPSLQKQMLLFQLKREAQNILENGKFWPVEKERPRPKPAYSSPTASLGDLFGGLFGAK